MHYYTRVHICITSSTQGFEWVHRITQHPTCTSWAFLVFWLTFCKACSEAFPVDFPGEKPCPIFPEGKIKWAVG